MSIEQSMQLGDNTDMENLGPISLKLNGGLLPIDSKSGAELVRNAVIEIRDAITVKPDGTIRFSRVEQSAYYVENSTIRFDSFNERRESLLELKREFPNLHNVICLLHDYPAIKKISDVMKDFQYFLLAISNINEYVIFVSTEEKDNVRVFSRACCEYVLGNTEKPEFPEFYQKKENSNLIDRADLLIISSTYLYDSIASGSCTNHVGVNTPATILSGFQLFKKRVGELALLGITTCLHLRFVFSKLIR